MIPTFVIIGEQKCGTGWLRDRLREHPCVFCHPRELNFFNSRRRYARGMRWYAQQLRAGRHSDAIGEKSPDYFWLDRPGTDWIANPLEAIARDLPHARIVLSLRDPVSRAVSAFYHHLHHRGRRIHPRIARRLPLEDLLFGGDGKLDERWAILKRGFYAGRVRLAHQLFGERLLTLLFEEDIVGDPARGLRRVCDHIGVDFRVGRFQLRDNPKERKPSYIELLAGHYLPVLRPVLRQLPLGRPFLAQGVERLRFRLSPLYVQDVAETLRLLGRPEITWPALPVREDAGK